MKAGALDRKIYLQRPTCPVEGENLGAYGEVITDANAWEGDVQEFNPWTKYATMRAEIVIRKADEQMRDYGASTEQWITFRIRFRDDVQVGDRVLYEGRPYVIKQVIEIGRRKGLEIKALARGPQA